MKTVKLALKNTVADSIDRNRRKQLAKQFKRSVIETLNAKSQKSAKTVRGQKVA